ncbi:inorganic phosphate transporter [Streptomyces sp. NBC_01485]|uniref:inorganic phosphate transporter n=1 Tax=Streptomyces sp. NBC_01485 TaxID=2903884 RepID=UPI003FCE314A
MAVVIVTALAFDFTNGFHDTANAMATSIATGALKPRTAVLISGALNIVGAFLSTEVAKTISGGIVDDTLVSPGMIFAGLVGAILWNLLTWLVGLPSSSSHALFGGLIGAVRVGAGSHGVHFDKVAEKVLIPAVASPLVAGVAAVSQSEQRTRFTIRQIDPVRQWKLSPMDLLELLHQVDNSASCRVAQKCRYELSGLLPAAPPAFPLGAAVQ